jgi:hypothetical protein
VDGASSIFRHLKIIGENTTLINKIPELSSGDWMTFRKGQAALDFLMTYGWAIALVVIIAAVLFSMGLFDTSNFVGNKATGFSGVAVKDWTYTAGGAFSVLFSNQVGQAVNINNVNISIGGAGPIVMSGSNATVQVGANSGSFNATGLPSGAVGNGYTAAVVVSYTTPSGFNYTSAGTLTGKMV